MLCCDTVVKYFIVQSSSGVVRACAKLVLCCEKWCWCNTL